MIWLDMANLPVLGVFFQSAHHVLRVDNLAHLLALEWVTLNGIWCSSSVASLASWSALSLPGMPQWLGHQEIDIKRFSCVVRRGRITWWNLRVKY